MLTRDPKFMHKRDLELFITYKHALLRFLFRRNWPSFSLMVVRKLNAGSVVNVIRSRSVFIICILLF
jgi:hypothetical protein